MSNLFVLSLLFAGWVAFQIGILYGTSWRRQHMNCVPMDDRQHSIYNVLRRSRRSSGNVEGTLLETQALVTSPQIWGLSTIDVVRFTQMFRSGMPWFGFDEGPKKFGSSVLLLHLSNASLPSGYGIQTTIDGAISIPHRSGRPATANCQQVLQIVSHLKLRDGLNSESCLAMVLDRYGSPLVQKWIHDENGGGNWTMSGRYQFHEPHKTVLQDLTANRKRDKRTMAFAELARYLSEFDGALERLRPIAAQVAQAGNNQTMGSLIVLTANLGHSDLFMNYVCACRAAGIDLSKLLLFATDQETFDMAHSMGIAAFYDEKIYAGIPTGAAKGYGDAFYSKIMMTKAYCVHMVSQLGYNFLFQDVDITPYQPNYLEWWIDHAKAGFDLYFQMDFSGRADYAPWNANSGCYYAVNNARTQYFFTSLLLNADLILKTRSHQAPMHALLNEHHNHFGLRVKTLRQEHEIIPLGWHFHRSPDLFLDPSFKNRTMAVHMNWNDHKGAKRAFLEQMGDWYIHDACVNQSLSDASVGISQNSCCVDHPRVVCHYQDLPSAESCRGSPSFIEGRKSLWPARSKSRGGVHKG